MTDPIHPVRWGILGAGGIAQDFVCGAAGSATGTIAGLGLRDPAGALPPAFAPFPVIGDYDALLASPAIDAVYIAVPHPLHAQWAIRAAEAGKHVLCEKPMGMDAAEVARMFAAARAHGTFLGEAYMYRFHPLLGRALDLIAQGTIGTVRLIKASFGFAAPFDPAHRLYDPALGGGAILDVGGYMTSIARILAGAEPLSVKGSGLRGASGVDEVASAVLAFPGGIQALLSCSIALAQDNVLQVIGTRGRIEVDEFWFGTGKRGGRKAIRVHDAEGAVHAIEVDCAADLYSFQFEAANRAIRAGAGEFTWPGPDAADSLANARCLDAWLAEVG